MATTYYVDGRVASSGNGTTPATALKTLAEATLVANVPSGSTIEVIENSGPYAMLNHVNTVSYNKSLTWNFNGNAIRHDIDANAQGWVWHKSNNELFPDAYYVTTVGGLSPFAVAIKSCEIWDGDIWSWSATSTNMSADAGNRTAWYPFEWVYGDYDSLGFSTLYVSGVGDPTGNGSVKVFVPTNAAGVYPLTIQYNRLTNVFNDLVLSGSNGSLLFFASPIILNRPQFRNSDYDVLKPAANASYSPNGSKFNFSKFYTGHNGITIAGMYNLGAIDINNSYFYRTHLLARTLGDTPCTLNLKNNASKELLAGAICWDYPTPVLAESNNQFDIDPLSPHGGKSLAWTGNGNRYWLETAATDYPALADTTTTTSVSPGTDVDGKITNRLSRLAHGGAVITGVNDGAQTDPWGNTMLDYPNIGADQFDYAPGFGPWAAFDESMPALTLPPDCPGDLKHVQTWRKVATAKEIGKY